MYVLSVVNVQDPEWCLHDQWHLSSWQYTGRTQPGLTRFSTASKMQVWHWTLRNVSSHSSHVSWASHWQWWNSICPKQGHCHTEGVSTTNVCCFLGMANQLSTFSPNLADLTQPLQELLIKECLGVGIRWAFQQIKDAHVTSPVLALFPSNLETVVSASASSYCLRKVL